MGVTLDKKLSFIEHVKSVTKKMTSNIFINRLRSFGMVKTDLSYIYNTLLKTHIEYAITTWASANEQYLVTIDNIQKLAVRLGTIDEFETVETLFEKQVMSC